MHKTAEATGQDAQSASKNARFFHDNRRYAHLIASLETYHNIRKAVDREIAGARNLLDVGNGGVFDYDTSLARRIVGVDLFLDGTPRGLDDHITLRRGDALALQELDESYDLVLENSLLHHLISDEVSSTLANIRRAVDETYRVLEPGGRLVIMESCVSLRAFSIERRLFGGLRYLARTPLMRHPATLQFPAKTIAGIIAGRFGNVEVTSVPVGRWIIHFGYKWPTALTPARPYVFTATKALNR